MAEVAGLAIGTASLIIQLFELTVKSYHALHEPQRAVRSFDNLDAQLAVEKQRLIEWGNAALAQLKPGDQMESGSCLTDAIGRTLRDIMSNSRRIASIRAKYVPEIERPSDASPTPRLGFFQVEELFCSVNKKGTESDLSNDLDTNTDSLFTKLTISKRKRLKWTVKDAALVEGIIAELRRANDSLFSLLPAILRESAEQAARASVLVESDNQSMKVIAKLDQPQYKEVAAAMQVKQAVVESDEENSAGSESLDNEFSESQVLLEESGYVRSLATLKRADNDDHHPDTTVLVEWKRTAAEGFSMDRQRQLMRLLQRNAVPLNFRTLHCIGSFRVNPKQHNEAIGVLFETPHTATGNIDLVTLHDIVSAPKKKKPPLGDRFHLAYTLANAVHELHASSWLHKNIRSANVLFFQEHISTIPTAIRGTSLPNRDAFWVGFDYARPAGTQEISENPELAALEMDLYHHPTYQFGREERYRPFFDVYSLGIVLLEIGAWRPIHTFQKKGQTVEEFRQRLLQQLVPQLGPEMGAIYQGAVATCLSDALDDGTHLVTQPYQTRFRRRVVNELRKCRA